MAFQGKKFTPEMKDLVVNLKHHYAQERRSGKSVPTKNAESRVAVGF